MADDSKDAGDPKKGGGSANLASLNANAKPFETCGSPTLDPYSGPFAISTQPGHVPPAQIPPQMPQPSKQAQTSRTAHNQPRAMSRGGAYPPQQPR